MYEDQEIKEYKTDTEKLNQNGFNNINISCSHSNQDDISPYIDKLCCVTFSDELIEIVEKQDDSGNTRNQLRIDFLKLQDNNKIKAYTDFFKDDTQTKIYKIAKTNQVLDENWDENDWKNRANKLLSVDDGYEPHIKEYFLEHFGKYVGPFEYQEYQEFKGKSGLFIQKNKNPLFLEEKDIIIFGDNSDDEYIIVNNGGSDGGKTKYDLIKENRSKLIKDIYTYRPYDNNMICNMLICITQGFLTVFAGEPGTGKTSICDKIAQVLGASKNDINKNRYLSISVERGWTSKNDLIGYLNPLNNEPFDATGLHAALDKVDSEKDALEKAAPYLVLLDEANLSQMEHYWSSFIKLADDDARRKTPLHFSSEKKFTIPDWFKFLATINNDQTTESLSPRLLDRAWVITLPTLEKLTEELTGDDSQNEDKDDRISWVQLHEMFEGNLVNDGLFEKSNEELQKIYEIFKDGDKPVSPRSKIAIERYLRAALSCFEGDDDEKRNDAIDFILLQRLLPMLNGYISDKLKEELEKFITGTNEENPTYPLSAEKFKSMCKQEDFSSSSFVSFFM